MPRPANELPQNVPDHMKLMLDLIVLAFQMDKTRVATLMLNNDLSQMNFRFLEGVQGALHLDLTHNGRAAEKEAMYLKTNQFHIAQFAYLTQRMKEIEEGETTLLDNSILMLASNLFDGDAAQRRPDADPADRQGRRHAQDRPHPRLSRQGRRQPPGLQPAPVADGPHGREARSLRRRDDAAGGALIRTGDPPAGLLTKQELSHHRHEIFRCAGSCRKPPCVVLRGRSVSPRATPLSNCLIWVPTTSRSPASLTNLL